jgi:hypothetical protein
MFSPLPLSSKILHLVIGEGRGENRKNGILYVWIEDLLIDFKYIFIHPTTSYNH